MVSYRELMAAMDPVRTAYWKKFCAEKGKSFHPKWSVLVDYIVDNQQTLPICQKLYELARQDVAPNRTMSGIAAPALPEPQQIQEMIQKKMQSNYWRQSYLILRGLRGAADASDSRGLEVLNFISEGRNSYIPIKALTCPLLSAGWDDTAPLLLPQNRFVTVPSTTFEMVLFLMSCKLLKEDVDMKAGSRPSKRRKTTPNGADDPREGPLTSDMAQRIAYTVQLIVRGWNAFAVSKGFQDCQSMLGPFISFDKVNVCYTVIQNPEHGESPAETFLSFSGDCQPTADRTRWYKDFEKRKAMDGHLRAFAEAFLQDIRTHPIAETTFTLSKTSGIWDVEDLFLTDGELPKRFENISKVESALKDTEQRQEEEDEEEQIEGQHEEEHEQEQGQKAEEEEGQEEEEEVDVQEEEEEEVDEIRPVVEDMPENVSFRGCTPERTSCEKDCACTETWPILENAMKPYCRVYGAPFEELMTIDEHTNTAPIQETAQLVLTDPPFNTRRKQGKANSDHDVLTVEQMKSLVEEVSDILRPGGHLILFCSFQQFHDWHRMFAGFHVTEQGKHILVFKVDNAPLTFCPKIGHYQTNPARKSCTLLSITQYALHATKLRAGPREMDMVNYTPFGYVTSQYPPYTNIMNDIGRLEPGEQVRQPAATACGSMPLRPEQKSRKMLQELVCRFSQPGDIVVDFFGGTFSTAIACLRIPEHRVFIGTELDPDCFTVAVRNLLKEFASVITGISANDQEIAASKHFRSDLRGKFPEKVLNAAKLALQHSKRQPSVIDRDWAAPPGFPAYQAFPLHISVCLATIWGDPDFMAYKGKSPCKWPRSLQGKLHQSAEDALLAAECARLGVYVAKSRIRHPQAGMGLFAARSFAKGHTIGTFYGTLVYHDLSKRSQKTKSYGKGILEVSVDRFTQTHMMLMTSGEEFQYDTKDHSRKSPNRQIEIESVYLVPARFSAAGYINDPRYGSRDAERDKVATGSIARRVANVTSRPSHDTFHRVAHIERHKAMTIVAKQPIDVGEELYLDYGCMYSIV